MITCYIVWVMDINHDSRSYMMQFHLRPELVTLDEREARNFAKGVGTLTPVQEIQIPTPEGWDPRRDKIKTR
jgi:hypothetical protein